MPKSQMIRIYKLNFNLLKVESIKNTIILSLVINYVHIKFFQRWWACYLQKKGALSHPAPNLVEIL